MAGWWRPTVKRLDGIGPFAACSPPELRRIDRLVRERSVSGHRTLIREGDVGEDCYVVVDGIADVVAGGRTIARLGPGAIFGEIALLDGEPRTASVVSRSAMRLLLISGDDLEVALRLAPSLTLHVAVVLAGRLRLADAACARAASLNDVYLPDQEERRT